ncbi:uncharacterized protein LOC119180142 isoform X9 [Rhipicephalus microplus]|uniref:uncharacterized protein LOC119180142 isoform X9 n=1 Tax=Rhipicephalus microplus TaxID=6941 RepID=UPI003F6AF5AC
MSLCFLHALFTFILMLALSGSKEMVLEPSLCPVNSSTIHNCVNTTWNSLQCQDESFDEMTGPSYPVPIKYWDERIPLQIQASMCYMTMNLTLSCPLIKIGAKEQYLMFRQTWNYMLLTELIELKKQPLCSIWAKNDFTRKSKVDKYTLAVFYAICKDAVYDGYPKFCPKAEK